MSKDEWGWLAATWTSSDTWQKYEKIKIKNNNIKLDKFSNKKKKNDLLLLRYWPPFIWWTPNLVVADLF